MIIKCLHSKQMCKFQHATVIDIETSSGMRSFIINITTSKATRIIIMTSPADIERDDE